MRPALIHWMSRIGLILIGFIFGAVIVGSGWYLDDRYALLARLPPQQPFDPQGWQQGDTLTRGRMYHDVVRVLQEQRPTDQKARELLGPPGVTDKAYLNAADAYLVYQIDLGQRIGGKPFLHKLGLAFHKDGTFSHVAIWD